MQKNSLCRTVPVTDLIFKMTISAAAKGYCYWIRSLYQIKTLLLYKDHSNFATYADYRDGTIQSGCRPGITISDRAVQLSTQTPTTNITLKGEKYRFSLIKVEIITDLGQRQKSA